MGGWLRTTYITAAKHKVRKGPPPPPHQLTHAEITHPCPYQTNNPADRVSYLRRGRVKKKNGFILEVTDGLGSFPYVRMYGCMYVGMYVCGYVCGWISASLIGRWRLDAGRCMLDRIMYWVYIYIYIHNIHNMTYIPYTYLIPNQIHPPPLSPPFFFFLLSEKTSHTL